MREVLLLWMFAALSIGVVIIAVILALGVVFGAIWLLRGVVLFFLGMLESRPAREVTTNVITVGQGARAHVPWRVRATGPRRLARLQTGLVPPSPCLAQRGVAGVERRRWAGARHRGR